MENTVCFYAVGWALPTHKEMGIRTDFTAKVLKNNKIKMECKDGKRMGMPVYGKER